MSSTINAGTSGLVLTGSTTTTLSLATNGTTRATIDASGNVGIGTATPVQTLEVKSNNAFGQFTIDSAGGQYSQMFFKNNGTAVGSLFTDNTNNFLEVYGYSNVGIKFTTNNAEAMRISSGGNVGIGGTADAASRMEITGTAPSSGGITRGIRVLQTIPSSTTTTAAAYAAGGTTAAASFTLTNAYGFSANGFGIGAGSSITNMIGFIANDNILTGTNNYGFYGNVSAAANRWNFYAAGTADNYFAGNVGIGTTSLSSFESANGSSNLVVGSGSGAEGITIYSGNATNNYGAINFADGTTGDATYRGILGYRQDLDAMLLYTAATERMRIDSSGNVGIGTASPGFLFDTFNSSTATDYIAGRFYSNAAAAGESRTWLKVEKAANYGGAVGGYLSQGVGSGLIFGTQNNASTPTERMRITNDGNVGIGTASPTTRLDVLSPDNGTATIRVGATQASAASTISAVESFGTRNDGNTTFYGRLAAAFRRSDGTAIPSGQPVGALAFGGQWGTDTSFQSAKLLYAASIAGVAEGSFTSASAMATGIAFSTGSTGNSLTSPNVGYGTERMRITSAGNVGIGTASPGTKLHLYGAGTTSTAYTNGDAAGATLYLQDNGGSAGNGGQLLFGSFFGASAGIKLFLTNGTGPAGDLLFQVRTTSGNVVERMRLLASGGFSVGTTADPGAGAIYATGNITAYYSDARLKDFKGKIDGALDKVNQLNGYYYTENAKAEEFGYNNKAMQVGVSAQEVKAVLPEVVSAAPFDLDMDGSSKSGENYMTVNYEKLVPLLIEAIKELKAEVEALKAAK